MAPKLVTPGNMEIKYQQVTVFTKEGATFTFKNVGEMVVNEYAVSFDYIAMSDGRVKHGTFFVRNLAGVSVTE